MKKTIFLSPVFITAFLFYCSIKKPIPDRDKNMIQNIITETTSSMQSGMMKILLEHINKNGYANSVKFCNSFAPEGGKSLNERLKEKFSSDYNISNFKFRRTSLKYRNPKNAPDKFEADILDSWEKNELSGKKAETFIAATSSGYRILVPLRISMKTCLGCHGMSEAMDGDAAKVIKNLYPDDKAIDFKEGDLRGAISIVIEK